MRTKPGHFTTTDPDYLRSRLGKSETKLKNGQWVKIANGTVYRGPSRAEVRELAKAS